MKPKLKPLTLGFQVKPNDLRIENPRKEVDWSKKKFTLFSAEEAWIEEGKACA